MNNISKSFSDFFGHMLGIYLTCSWAWKSACSRNAIQMLLLLHAIFGRQESLIAHAKLGSNARAAADESAADESEADESLFCSA